MSVLKIARQTLERDDFWHFLEILILFQSFHQITDIIIKENTQLYKRVCVNWHNTSFNERSALRRIRLKQRDYWLDDWPRNTHKLSARKGFLPNFCKSWEKSVPIPTKDRCNLMHHYIVERRKSYFERKDAVSYTGSGYNKTKNQMWKYAVWHWYSTMKIYSKKKNKKWASRRHFKIWQLLWIFEVFRNFLVNIIIIGVIMKLCMLSKIHLRRPFRCGFIFL